MDERATEMFAVHVYAEFLAYAATEETFTTSAAAPRLS